MILAPLFHEDTHSMADIREMPLFPLNTVLFPGMVLPLHIFEPRYKVMISECVRENKPFGVILIKEGPEVGGNAMTYGFGTSAYVTQVEQLKDDRMNIQTVGYQRFKLHSLQAGRPFQVGLVEDLPIPGEESAEVSQAVNTLAPMLDTYLASLKKLSALSLSFDEIPRDGRALAYLTAIMLPIRNEEKQHLLEASDLATMLSSQIRLLRREMLFLRKMLIVDQSSERSSDKSSFSKN
jgi:uncharacterized protein